MFPSFLAVATVTLLASHAAASTFSSADSLVRRAYISSVENVPSACEDTCSGSNKLSDTCHTFDPTTANADYLACFCGDTLHRTLTKCLDCTAGADSSREGQLASQLRDYETTCKNVGRTLPAFTLSANSFSTGSATATTSSTESATATSQSGSTGNPTGAPENNGSPGHQNSSTPGIAIFASTLFGAVGMVIAVLA